MALGLLARLPSVYIFIGVGVGVSFTIVFTGVDVGAGVGVGIDDGIGDGVGEGVGKVAMAGGIVSPVPSIKFIPYRLPRLISPTAKISRHASRNFEVKLLFLLVLYATLVDTGGS